MAGTEEEKISALQELIRARIENLRPKLLDLSRRNPLISTRLSPRSTSLIRIVDELPDALAARLCSEQEMRFVPLPPLDIDPKDEQSNEFQDALSSARLVDEEYLKGLETLNPNDDDSIEQGRQIERTLKDLVRTKLGMPLRQKKADLSLSQHAINNGISPHYELPSPEDTHEDGRHGDENIQTLLLPEDLERRFNALMTKCRTWEQETGINVLHVAFGFLEWAEPNSSESSFAPLVLLPVKLEKRKTHAGVEFWVTADGDDTETNFVMAEKLRLEFGINLPRFQGGSINDYFKEVTEAAPLTIKWKVRRQVAIGIFPSARMAMYEDTGRPEIARNSIISSLFGGTAVGGAAPFADEYDVDHPDIEIKVPFLVLDADSSQFSTIVDAADGKNLTVEGPPGTGKSQTIVNTIANAIAQGKKVLFVAEKMAALEVVKSRLEAVGLGEFLLPLQAERSTREQVINSIRSRLEMVNISTSSDYETRIKQFRHTRSELAAYVETVASPFGQTGLKVHDVLGKSIATSDALTDAPRQLQNPNIIDIETYDSLKREIVREKAEALTKAWKEAEIAELYWCGLKVGYLDRFAATELKSLAQDAAAAYEAANVALCALGILGITTANDLENLNVLLSDLKELAPLQADMDCSLVSRVSSASGQECIKTFLDDCAHFQSERTQLSNFVIDTAAEQTVKTLREIAHLCETNDIDRLNTVDWHKEIAALDVALVEIKRVYSLLKPFIEYFPSASTTPIDALAKAGALVRATVRNVIAIRSEATADPVARTLIQSLSKKGQGLLCERERLSNFMRLPEEIVPAELHIYAEVFRTAGLFRWLSPSFKIAKRKYIAHSRQGKFVKEQAAKDFGEVASWKEAALRFVNDAQAPLLFGPHFKGLDTDFDQFERLAVYYQQVEDSFSGPQYRSLRSLLMIGESDILWSIPELPTDGQLPTFAEVEEAIARLTRKIASRKTLVSHLENLLPALSNPAEAAVSILPSIANRLERLQDMEKALDANSLAKLLLLDRFQGHRTISETFKSELAALTILEKSQANSSLLTNLLETSRITDAGHAVENAIRYGQKASGILKLLCAKSGIEFGQKLKDWTQKDIAQFFKEAAADDGGLFAHSRLSTARAEINKLGFGWAIEALEAQNRSLDSVAAVLDAAVFRAMAIRVYESHGSVLSRCPGTRLDNLRATLAKLDREIIQRTRQHLRSMIRQSARPPSGTGVGRKSEWTEMALIENEISKKQRYVPVRDLTQRAGKALLELKPCWMMSPLAVAQYLPPNVLFDLCIIDEASQMPPEDAVGALARCRHVMVVGDTNQLPPTSFFKKMLEDEDADEDEAVFDESILEMSSGVFRPGRRLRWHYRSKHSGLIQFSNQHIYNNDLVVFPSPNEAHPDMGVSLVPVEGRYHAGINAEEASAMIVAILQFMRTNTNRSLGVVTLNQKQRDLLLEEWERAVARDTSAARYVEDWVTRNDGLECFFIKNLENVQGDERDVIFIGTVYGPEKPGAPVMQRFGPIAGLAGKRRLNVLFSRAKQQIVTFSSMTAADIRADEVGNPGAHMLKGWLEYAATKKIYAGKNDYREPDSDFEIFVISQIRSIGCEPVPQVGVAGYRIDIGIRHPLWPHGFIMGVECDGATYHSSRSARDRDRLREEVLSNLGWKLHRIWSTDWFNDPRREAERLRRAIEVRLQELQSSSNIVAISSLFQRSDTPSLAN